MIVDSESDEEMPDDGPVEPDDAIQFEEEGDNVEAFDEAQGNFRCFFINFWQILKLLQYKCHK